MTKKWGFWTLSAGCATWTNGERQSEIDHVIIHQQHRHLWGAKEVRPGVGTKDHKTIWVRFMGGNMEEDGKGEQRKISKNWGKTKMDEKAWKTYKAEVTSRFQNTTIEAIKDPRRRAKKIQDMTLEIATKIWEERNGNRRKEAGEDKKEEKEANTDTRTREQHLERIG